MDYKTHKIFYGLISLILAITIIISCVFSCYSNVVFAHGDTPAAGYYDRFKELYNGDEPYEDEEREITQEEKQELYDCVRKVEDEFDVIYELNRAKEEIDLPEQGVDSYDICLYLRDLDTAIGDYTEYRPYLEDLLYTEFSESSTYSWNWFKKIFYKIVTAIGVALLHAIDWKLSAELLSHARNNTVLDSVYYPINIGKINQSPSFNAILSNSETNGSGEFKKEVDGKDLYYSLAKFDYYKTENNSVVELCDRYDFDPDSEYGSGLSEIANFIGMRSQELGEIIPYQVVIDIVDVSQGQKIINDYMDSYGYSEKVVTMGLNDYVFLELNCEGKCIIQTCGSKSTKLKLFRGGNLVGTFQGGGYFEDDSAGYWENTLFCYDFDNANYTLEVAFSGSRCAGATKVVITPYEYDEGSNDDLIFSINNRQSFVMRSYIDGGKVDVNTFTPIEDGYYYFSISSILPDFSVYVVDPRSARNIKERDGSLNKDKEKETAIATSAFATNIGLKKSLTANVPYLLVIANENYYNINFEISCLRIEDDIVIKD